MENQIIFKTKPEQKNLIVKASNLNDESISAFVRRSALEKARQILKQNSEDQA